MGKEAANKEAVLTIISNALASYALGLERELDALEANRAKDDADTAADLRQALDQADLDKDDLRTALGDAQEKIRNLERELRDANRDDYRRGFNEGEASGRRGMTVRVNEAEQAANRWSERAEAYQAVLETIKRTSTDQKAVASALAVLQQHALK